MSAFATWSSPRGLSATKENSIVQRAQHYRFKIKHHLRDGTRIIPNVNTVFSIIQAYDNFGPDIPVAISTDSYEVFEDND